MSKKFVLAAVLLVLLVLILPIEHKYDKWFRFYSLTLIPKTLEISKQYDKKIYFYISDLIALSFTFLGLFWCRIPLKKWFSSPLWIVWFLGLISIIPSPFCNYPIPYIRLLQLFTPIALFSFLTNIEKNFTRILLHSLVIAALFQTTVAICQYFHQAPLGLRLLGEVRQMSSFYMPDQTRWLLDSFFDLKQKTPLIMRASGTFSHTNVLGGFLLISILATYTLSFRRKIWLITLPFQLMALGVCFSRSALFGWGIATFLWFCLNAYKTGMKRLSPIFYTMIFSFGAVSTLLYPQYVQRGGVVSYNSLVSESDQVRKIQQNTAFQIIKDHPFFGLGFTQFSERSSPYFQEEGIPDCARVTAPHNIFLFLACETGIFSLLAFLIFLGRIFWSFMRGEKNQDSILFFSILTGLIFISCCDFYPILFQPGKLMFFLIAALLVVNLKKNMIESLNHGQSFSRTSLENV